MPQSGILPGEASRLSSLAKGREYIYRKDGQPVFLSAIGNTLFECGYEEDFLIITSASD